MTTFGRVEWGSTEKVSLLLKVEKLQPGAGQFQKYRCIRVSTESLVENAKQSTKKLGRSHKQNNLFPLTLTRLK